MDEKERIALIRRGNEFYNKGDYIQAEKIYIATRYQDGLTRLGDYYYYDLKQPLRAYKFYRIANRQDRINEIFERMVFALKTLITDEKPRPEVHLEPVTVNPKLKLYAEEILRQNGIEPSTLKPEGDPDYEKK